MKITHALTVAALSASVASIGPMPALTASAQAGPQGCSSTWISPEITAHGSGTAVWFGIGFQCTKPVSYSLTVAAYSGNAAAGRGTRSGISSNPAVSEVSSPCVSNKNSSWSLQLTGWIEDPNGTRHSMDDQPGSWLAGVAVGCSLSG
ncbi:hypothetical protein OG874_32290 [Nocardia sp. NBC_00565]|uniref:hypothetical protein n=1 Tax=Nocardia sp. NBC_00565 TaxID=2975993 RepID=UPI002E80FF67|nr:hypothetical protein [Nocardia sp. NBC_00565]WUC01448.1 hypothetical protein OG874_32290 [Nocardia sp. NBC_00565]